MRNNLDAHSGRKSSNVQTTMRMQVQNHPGIADRQHTGREYTFRGSGGVGAATS
jgi:hypothetical protein